MSVSLIRKLAAGAPAAVRWLARVAPAVMAYLAGRRAQKAKEQARDDKAAIEDLERRLDAAREIDRAGRDDGERERVRTQYTRPDPPGE